MMSSDDKKLSAKALRKRRRRIESDALALEAPHWSRKGSLEAIEVNSATKAIDKKARMVTSKRKKSR